MRHTVIAADHIFKLVSPVFSVAALKQVLVTQLMSQEAAEQTKRSTGARLLRTTSLRTPIDSHARIMVHNSSDKNSSQTEDPSQDLGSGDTGFFDSPEDYGESRQNKQHIYKNQSIPVFFYL